jgi:hypothetical protein
MLPSSEIQTLYSAQMETENITHWLKNTFFKLHEFTEAVHKSMWICACYINYLLTPRSRVLLQKLTSSQLVKKFPAFYRTWSFITAFTRAHHLSPILSACYINIIIQWKQIQKHRIKTVTRSRPGLRTVSNTSSPQDQSCHVPLQLFKDWWKFGNQPKKCSK